MVSRQNTTRICFGYQPGMPLVDRPATTPDCEPHEPWPSGYIASSEYADLLAQAHDQRPCKGCGRWLIWEPKGSGTGG
jgi:hypothetical protein